MKQALQAIVNQLVALELQVGAPDPAIPRPSSRQRYELPPRDRAGDSHLKRLSNGSVRRRRSKTIELRG
jgi:hypothetical protein